VQDDFTKPLGDASEGMLSAAIQYAESGACPVSTASSVSGSQLNAPSGSQASGQSNASESSLAIKPPHTQRDELILHNKINEPILRGDN
jgi:hypothetical protein